MTSLSVLRSCGSQLGRVQLVLPTGVRSTHTTPANQLQVTTADHVNVTDPNNQRASAIPDRAASHGYSPFKVDFKKNKVEWALARVDDLVNWGRKVGIRLLIRRFQCYFLGLPLAIDFWSRLLRCRDDAHCSTKIRHGQVRKKYGLSQFVPLCLVTYFSTNNVNSSPFYIDMVLFSVLPHVKRM